MEDVPNTYTDSKIRTESSKLFPLPANMHLETHKAKKNAIVTGIHELGGN